MPTKSIRLVGAALALFASALRGQSAPPAPAASATAPANAADAAFMTHMIGHHAQALQMVGLLKTRTQRDDMRLLGERIEVSQRDEIASMGRWLRRHGLPVPDTSAARHDMGGMAHDMAGMSHDMPGMPRDSLMPGMLTPAEMARLAQATGPAFDRLFLAGMIRHHQGALAMVQSLFAQRGAAQDTEVYQFASDVDADQRAEIARMQALLRALPPAAPDTRH